MWHLQTTDCLVGFFYGAGVWPGSRSTVVKNGWKRGENPHIHFWKHFLPFPQCWGWSWVCVELSCLPPGTKVPKLSSPIRGRRDQTQKHRLEGKQGWQKATSPDSALPWWHQSLLFWHLNTVSVGQAHHRPCSPLLLSSFGSSYLACFHI